MTNITGALSPTDLKEFQLQGSIMPGLWSLNLDLTIATKQPKIEMFFAAYKGRVRAQRIEIDAPSFLQESK